MFALFDSGPIVQIPLLTRTSYMLLPSVVGIIRREERR